MLGYHETRRAGFFPHSPYHAKPFHATGLFLYPLKTLENQRFYDVFREYRKRSVAWNGLTWSSPGSRRVILIYQKLIPKAFDKSFLGTFWIYIYVGVGHKEMNSTHMANPMKPFFPTAHQKLRSEVRQTIKYTNKSKKTNKKRPPSNITEQIYRTDCQ